MYVVIAFFLISDLVAVGIVCRYRHRICDEIDNIYRNCYAISRNSNLEAINELPLLQDDTCKWYCKYKVIAHGGGGIDGKTCTDTKEAIEQSYYNGTRMSDIDIQTTSDSIWVCSHGWLDNIEQNSKGDFIRHYPFNIQH